jgi:hypothetical protein
MRLTGIILVSLLAAPAAARAQTVSGSYHDAMQAAAALQIAAQRSSPVAPLVVNRDLLAPERFSSRAPGATLMIIGGAGVVAGILVGGSGGALLILGGVGLGAYGFYLYMK